MHITRVPIITFTDMKQSCSANEHHVFCLNLVLFVVCLFLKTALFGLKQVLSNFYAIGLLWRRCNFRGKCRAHYCDVAKTTCGIRQSNYLPLLLYRIPLTLGLVTHTQNVINFSIIRNISNSGVTYQILGAFRSPF